MRIALPKKVNTIIGRLEEHGYEAYAVGGCVRDSILGRIPQDWDVTTSARPEQVKELFPRTVDTGIRHGTVTVLLGREGFEVTTYRVDGEYEDARHPKQVTFTASLAEDLKRRDFTINAMAYRERDGLTDLFGGVDDLERGTVRCVGDAGERFGEDALRILRAVRFAAQLGFSIEAGTKAAAIRMAPSLARISAERIQAELVKLVVSAHPEELRTLYETGIADVILPELSAMMQTRQNTPHHIYSVGEHTIHCLQQIAPGRILRLTMLFHDVAKPLCRTTDKNGIDHFYGHPRRGAEMAEKILRRLKFDNDTVARVSALIRAHDDRPPLNAQSVRRAIHRNGFDLYPDLFAVQRADILAQSGWMRKEKLAHVDGYERIYREICERGECLFVRDLAVNGEDLIAAGMKPGREIGRVLDRMLEDVLECPAHNDREILMQKFKRREYC